MATEDDSNDNECVEWKNKDCEMNEWNPTCRLVDKRRATSSSSHGEM